MPFLRELKLNNCDDINISSMAALSQCVTLEVNIRILIIQSAFIFSCVKMKLEFCISILTDFLIQTITLDSCALLTAVTLNLQQLHRISLAHCCKYSLSPVLMNK